MSRSPMIEAPKTSRGRGGPLSRWLLLAIATLAVVACKPPANEPSLAQASAFLAPSIPFLIAPIAFAKVTTTTPSFTAIATDFDLDPLTYVFEIDTDPGFPAPLLAVAGPCASGGPCTTATSPALADGVTYFWRAQANDGGLPGLWSATRSLTVDVSQPDYSWFVTAAWEFRQGMLVQAKEKLGRIEIGYNLLPYWTNDFEGGTTGDFSTYTTCAGCIFEASTLEAVSGNYSMRLDDVDPVGYLGVDTPDIITAIDGRLEYWTKRNDGGQGETAVTLQYIQGGYKDTMSMMQWGWDMEWLYRIGLIATSFVPPEPYVDGVWSKITIDYDTGVDTSDIYLDGRLLVADASNAANGLPTLIDVRTTWNALPYTDITDLYFDDFAAYSATAVATYFTPAVDYFDRPATGVAWGVLDWSEVEPAATGVSAQLQYDSDPGPLDAWLIVPNSAVPSNSSGLLSGPISLAGVDPGTYDRLRVSFGLSRSTAVELSPQLLDVSITWDTGVLPVATRILYDSGTGQAATVGTALAAPFTVQVIDAGGSGVGGIPVDWATTGGGGSTTPSTSTTDAAGFASATGTLGTISGTNNNTFTAASVGLIGSPVGFTASANPGVAVALAAGGIASPTAAGDPVTLSVEALDTYSNLATGYTGTVTFTSTDGSATLPANYTFVAGDGGVHTFVSGVTMMTPGTQSVTATDTVTTIDGSQTGILVTAGTATSLSVSGIPSPITAGSVASVTVEAFDSLGNRATGYLGTVSFTSSDGGALLPPNYTFTVADQGIHVVPGVTLTTAGLQSVAATDTVTPSIDGIQSGIQVDPAAAQSLVVSGIPSPVTAGVVVSVTVEARDAYGNRATGYAGTIGVTSSDPAATLPANYTFVGADQGLHVLTASLSFGTAGIQSVTATDTADLGITGTQTGIQVDPAGAAVFLVTGIPSPVAAGTVSSITVDVRDSFGNRATSYSGTVTFTSTDGLATLPSNYTFVVGDAGVRIFLSGVTLATVGTQAVTAADVSAPGVGGTQAGIQVEPGPAVRLLVSGVPSPIGAGVTADVQLEALDAFDNRATGYAGTVMFSSSDGAATLPANYLFTGADQGLHNFAGGITLQTTGLQSVSAADLGAPAINGTQGAIQVDAAPAVGLALTTVPATVVAGTPFSPTVEALDGFSNRATGYAQAVTFTSTDAQATLPGDYLFTAADQGIQVFTLGVTLVTAGLNSITVEQTGDPSLTATQTVDVQPGAPYAVVVTGPANGVAGSGTTVTLQLVDAYGNPTTGAMNVCLLATGSSGGAPSILPDDDPLDPSDACITTDALTGAAVLTVTDTKAETVTLDATSSGLGGSGTADGSLSIDVAPAAPDHLRLQPVVSQADACTEVDVVIQLVDAYDNDVTDPAVAAVAVSIDVTAASGTPEVTATDLAGASALPSSVVSGTTATDGSAVVIVRLTGAAANLTVGWAAVSLPANAALWSQSVAFVVGPVDASLSELTADTTAIVAAVSSARMTLRPRDACNLEVGAGRSAVFTSSVGSLSPTLDQGDGTYTSTFTAVPADCAIGTADILAQVEGVTLTTVVPITIRCTPPDPKATTVTPTAASVDGCAGGRAGGAGEFTSLTVTPFDSSGAPLPPGSVISLVNPAPGVRLGRIVATTDRSSSVTGYSVEVGSDRCGWDPTTGRVEPTTVVLAVDGVTLQTQAFITFTCPAVEASGFEFTSDPAVLPTSDTSNVVVTVLDVCQNPVFGRPITLVPAPDGIQDLLVSEVLPGQLTGDADGRAAFEVTSFVVGRTGVVASVTLAEQSPNSATGTSDSALLTFLLKNDALEVAYESETTQGVAGQEVTLLLTLRNTSTSSLDVTVTPDNTGLKWTSALGASLLSDGRLQLDAPLLAGESLELPIFAQLGMRQPIATSRVDIDYAVTELPEDPGARVASEPLEILVTGRSYATGCECRSGAGSAGNLAVWIGLWAGLLVVRRRRR